MQSIQLQTCISDDGILTVALSDSLKNRKVKGTVFIQPLNQVKQNHSSNAAIGHLFDHLRSQFQSVEDLTTPTLDEWEDL